MTEELVNKVKQLQSSNPEAKQLWLKYTEEKGGRTRDPGRHDAEFLQEFINMAEGGVAAPMVDMGGITEETDLVAYVKELQRSNADAKEQWLQFADSQGGGVLDPARHTKESLQSFLEHLSSGGSFVADGGANFGEFIKNLMRRSSGFKNAWILYCKQNAGGRCDPLVHDTSFHSKFFEHVGQVYVKSAGQSAPGTSLCPTMAIEPPAKKLKPMVAPAAAPVSLGPTRESLVEAVKSFQKSGPDNKELWNQYTDAYLGGVRDPNRHELAVLLEFCVNHGVPGVAGAAMGGVAAGGMAAMGGMGAITPVAAGGLFGAKVGTAVAGAGGAEKQALAERIKAFQKADRANSELWSNFCGKHKDPNKHEVAKLQEFCNTYGC